MLLSHSVSYTVSEEAFVSCVYVISAYSVSYGVYVGFGEILWYFYKAWIGFLKSFLRGFSIGLFFLEGFLEILLEGFLNSFVRAFFS